MMRTNDRRQIEAFLNTHQSLSECIIEELGLNDYATTLEVLMNYVWTDTGEIRSNLDEPHQLRLRFYLVQELHINNSLNPTILSDPNSMNWGMNEVALVKVINESELIKCYEPLPVPFHHVAFFWESDRRIDVIFSELEIVSFDGYQISR